jgi:hypothetical protein
MTRWTTGDVETLSRFRKEFDSLTGYWKEISSRPIIHPNGFEGG